MCRNARSQGDTWIVQGHEFAHVFRCTEPLQLCQSYGATERQRVEGLNVKRDLVHCQKRPSTEVKENYDTGTRAHLSDRAWRASTEASTTPPMSLEKFARVSRRSWIHVVTPWVHEEEDTCVSYEEEDTCVEELDTRCHTLGTSSTAREFIRAN
jgi:hypothetical protein